MILLDTSIWIDHLRRREEGVEFLLKRNQAQVHPFVIGEIALGQIAHYKSVINSLSKLPQGPVAAWSSVLFMIQNYALMGSGIGYVDAHLLASAKLQPNTRLWTRDKRLARIAATLDVAYEAQQGS